MNRTKIGSISDFFDTCATRMTPARAAIEGCRHRSVSPQPFKSHLLKEALAPESPRFVSNHAAALSPSFPPRRVPRPHIQLQIPSYPPPRPPRFCGARCMRGRWRRRRAGQAEEVLGEDEGGSETGKVSSPSSAPPTTCPHQRAGIGQSVRRAQPVDRVLLQRPVLRVAAQLLQARFHLQQGATTALPAPPHVDPPPPPPPSPLPRNTKQEAIIERVLSRELEVLAIGLTNRKTVTLDDSRASNTLGGLKTFETCMQHRILVSIALSALRQRSRGARLCAQLVGWTPVVSSR
jgi:hypothetical protein